MNAGQPVTFTDFFGLLVGEHILGPEVNTFKILFLKIIMMFF